MSDPDHPLKSAPTRPQRLNDDREQHNDLTELEDPLEEEAEHGRIGYGRFGEWTPYALAAGIILTIVIIAGFNWASGEDDSGSSDDSGSTTEPITRGEAPGFAIDLVDGASFDLASQRGKVVVVNFWATWCEPCKAEMPAMQALAAANPDDVVVIGIAEPYDEAGEVVAFAKTLGVTYPLAIDTKATGATGSVGRAFQVFGYPATYFIDADGNIVDAVFGPLPVEDLQEYVDRARSTTNP
ncbi:MAG: TlpA disulfide reductase family protein [Thermomicrobiales bacterium]